MSLTAVSTFAGVGGFDSAMQRCGNGAIDGRGGGIAGTLEARGSQFGTDAGSATAGHVVLVDHARREGRGGKGPLVSEDVSLTLATGNGQVLIQPTAFGLISSYVKIVRSGARDAGGGLPPEVWAERDVAPTLNAMDNTGESRATVLEVGATVRRLTPTECERLQGFPDVENHAIIELCLYDPPENSAPVEVLNPSEPRHVSHAVETGWRESASSAGSVSPTRDRPTNKPVQIDVLIAYEQNEITIRSRGKLLWSANTVTGKSSSALPMPLGAFALAVVSTTQIAAQIIRGGGGAPYTGATGSTAPSNGNALVRLYGAGITPPADGAKSSSITPRPPTTFTTSSRMGLSDTELILETSFFSVINAIAGFIPLPMHPDSSLRFHFTTKTGWTSHRINDKGELIEQADSARYKQMGNAVAVPVVEFIMQRLVEQENQ